MPSGVLRSRRAVRINVAIMRAFVNLRGLVHGSSELAGKLAELERRVSGQDREIQALLGVIHRLMEAESPTTVEGFSAE